MPNWCENELTVSGPAEELRKFREFANPLSAEKFLPIPDELKSIKCIETPSGVKHHTDENGFVVVNLAGVDIWEYARCLTVEGQDIPLSDEEQNALFEKYRARDSYEWRWKKWGSKWDFGDCKVEEFSDMIVYRFATAWGPPTPVIEKIAELYPTLSFLLSYGVEVQSNGSILFKEGNPLLWKYVGWEESILYDDPKSHIFSDKFLKSLCEKFPGFFADPARVANE